MLSLALQKSGRLHDASVTLLRECGIELNNGNKQLKSTAFNFPMEVYFLRDDDIPEYVADGVADAGIVGENTILESEAKVEQIFRLGFGKCRLSIALPKATNFAKVQDIHGLRIATSYPLLLQKFLEENQIEAEVHTISGSVEIAPGIGLADAICDLVSSGNTLFINGLKEVKTILNSEALLVGNPAMSDESRELLNKLLLRINAVKTAKYSKYILMNAPNRRLKEICTLLPGMKSPTIVPLAEEGWSSVQSVVQEDTFWEVIEQLKELEAEGILVVPIQKMII